MNNVIGMSIEEAKEYFESNNKIAEFVETKDVKNIYPDKRVVRVRQIENSRDTYEVLYTGFPRLQGKIDE